MKYQMSILDNQDNLESIIEALCKECNLYYEFRIKFYRSWSVNPF
jgi:hypothetical protein